MNNTTIEIEGGEVLANLEERTITGRLIPFNEEGRTNVGRFTVEAGAVDISEVELAPMILGLNTDHDRSANTATGQRVWQQDDGIYASWTIAATPRGDAVLADALDPNGKRKRLSGEFGPAVIRAGKLVAGHARLWGAALVEQGAFPGAMVLAADTPEADEPIQLDTTLGPDEDGHLAVLSTTLPTDITVNTPEGDVATYTPEAAPAEDNPQEGGSTVTATATEVLAGAQTPAAPIPSTLITPSTPTVLATTEVRGPTSHDVFAALASLREPNLAGNAREQAMHILAALSDITTTGLLDGGDVARPTWIGQLYQGISYERDFVNLGNLGTDITLAGKAGYTIHRGTSGSPATSLGGTWAGNKTAIPSGVGFTKSKESTLLRYAFGADVARELYDLPGGAEALEAFFALVAEDELIWSDERALEAWKMAAGLPVAAKTYPSVDGHDYEGALGMAIQGILAVKARKSDKRRDKPTFVIANELAFEQLIYTPKDLLPEFVNFTASTDWKGSADGLSLVVGDTGIVSTPSVIVGSGYAIDFDELAGGPLNINALDIANGGIDRAVHGYLQVFTQRPEAVVHIGTADTRANTTVYEVGDVAKVSAVVYQAVVAGTTSGSAPTAPAVGATVVDGDVTWLRIV